MIPWIFSSLCWRTPISPTIPSAQALLVPITRERWVCWNICLAAIQGMRLCSWASFNEGNSKESGYVLVLPHSHPGVTDKHHLLEKTCSKCQSQRCPDKLWGSQRPRAKSLPTWPQISLAILFSLIFTDGEFIFGLCEPWEWFKSDN